MERLLQVDTGLKQRLVSQVLVVGSVLNGLVDSFSTRSSCAQNISAE
jgi:hypothetical protein